MFTGKAMAQEPSVVFLFPGQGAQYLDMGRELYEGEPVFREEVDRCAEILQHHLDLDLRKVLYPDGRETSSARNADQPDLARPAGHLRGRVRPGPALDELGGETGRAHRPQHR